MLGTEVLERGFDREIGAREIVRVLTLKRREVWSIYQLRQQAIMSLQESSQCEN